MLVLFSGLPGSGKSTLAEAAARHFKIPVYARDNLQSFLYRNQLVTGNTVESCLLLFTLAENNLQLGIGTILDSTFPQVEFRQRAKKLAEANCIPFKVVYCYTSDREVWQRRWYERKAQQTISHWYDFTWDDVLAVEECFVEWNTEDILMIDAMNPLNDNIAKVIKYLSL